MGALKNSANSRSSNRGRTTVVRKPAPPVRELGFLEPILAGLFLALVSGAAIAWLFSRGYLLYFGDAEAHLNIARRILDSRTPGYDQIGTVWLPFPHLLMLPFVRYDSLWRTGLAGSCVGGPCFVIAGMFLFGATRRLLGSAPAWTAVALLAFNPNILYLQAIPMTEPVFLACVCGLLYSTVWLAESGSLWSALLAALCSVCASMTRYEGWFLIPFVAAAVVAFGGNRRWIFGTLFCVVAGMAPLYWLAHNYWYYGNPLEFYNGPYSARGIYQHFLDAGGARYRGDGNWSDAWLYFRTAAQLCAGWPLVGLGLAGIPIALRKRAFWPVILLLLSPVFYVWSLHSSGTPIFVPQLWPNSYYNTRYGLAALPLLVFCGGALTALVPARLRSGAGLTIALIAASPWLLYPSAETWICWKESQVNSAARRAWTHEAAEYLAANYRAGEGIAASFGDLTGILREAGIPIKESLHEGNGPYWMAGLRRPELLFHEDWALTIAGDELSAALFKAQRKGPRYRLERRIEAKGAPVIEIFRRD